MGKKINPRRIPRTQADVDDAELRGQEYGRNFMLYVVLFNLENVLNISHEDLDRLGKAVTMYCEQINKGEIVLKDVKKALEDEYGVSIQLN